MSFLFCSEDQTQSLLPVSQHVCTTRLTPYRLKMRELVRVHKMRERVHEVQNKHQGATLSLLLDCRLLFNSGFHEAKIRFYVLNNQCGTNL